MKPHGGKAGAGKVAARRRAFAPEVVHVGETEPKQQHESLALLMVALTDLRQNGVCRPKVPRGRRRFRSNPMANSEVGFREPEIARREADAQGICNVEFRSFDIRTTDEDIGSVFDIVHARFLLTHLDNPSHAIAAFYRYLLPSGLVIVEDIDFNGYFTYPVSKATQRYQELYCKIVQRRGGDPNIGPRLPILLTDGGFEKVEMTVVQPMGTQGEVKLMNAITLENIADVVLQDGLASRQEIDALIQELYRFAENPRTLAGAPRIIQAWGRRPAAN
jgi:hypothetical protein